LKACLSQGRLKASGKGRRLNRLIVRRRVKVEESLNLERSHARGARVQASSQRLQIDRLLRAEKLKASSSSRFETNPAKVRVNNSRVLEILEGKSQGKSRKKVRSAGSDTGHLFDVMDLEGRHP
jgi:hypothetical protein